MAEAVHVLLCIVGMKILLVDAAVDTAESHHVEYPCVENNHLCRENSLTLFSIEIYHSFIIIFAQPMN